ncbi:MAG TPA: zinc-finger domain-containing protein [Methylibium sp.]|uniref:zinc-finger domain-containing protein n=1 Tax=Methylibium sp. TaxID=2067992 RepID=UPI002DBA3F5F|nr:zinc-finger domain-containing protein [Methylibium sp.]HEU4460512.1 zinc-finger domain-containing protein [Methylibium sp.]
MHKPASGEAVVEVTAADLRGGAVFCPNPKMPLWSNHPRIFLRLNDEGRCKCPYCGTVYRLAAGEKLASH